MGVFVGCGYGSEYKMGVFVGCGYGSEMGIAASTLMISYTMELPLQTIPNFCKKFRMLDLILLMH
jgi:hypothetical protein